jgi:HEAT repeat protein
LLDREFVIYSYCNQESMKREWPDQEISILREQTSDKDPEVRRLAAFKIGNSGDKGSIDYLIKLLEDEDSTVRSYAAGALRIGDESTSKYLIKCLQDEENGVVGSAIQALGQITWENEEAIRSIGRFLHSADNHLVMAAIYALNEIGRKRNHLGLGNEVTIDCLLLAHEHLDEHPSKRVRWALQGCGYDVACLES